jgi:hypothetical protein
MTGRRLYELVCDAHGDLPLWLRGRAEDQLPSSLKAWAHLTDAERRMFNGAARRIVARRTRR